MITLTTADGRRLEYRGCWEISRLRRRRGRGARHEVVIRIGYVEKSEATT